MKALRKIILAVISITVMSWAQTIKIPPYLQNTFKNSTEMCFEFDRESQCVIKYAVDKEDARYNTLYYGKRDFHKIKLNNLIPGETYKYSLWIKNKQISAGKIKASSDVFQGFSVFIPNFDSAKGSEYSQTFKTAQTASNVSLLLSLKQPGNFDAFLSQAAGSLNGKPVYFPHEEQSKSPKLASYAKYENNLPFFVYNNCAFISFNGENLDMLEEILSRHFMQVMKYIVLFTGDDISDKENELEALAKKYKANAVLSIGRGKQKKKSGVIFAELSRKDAQHSYFLDFDNESLTLRVADTSSSSIRKLKQKHEYKHDSPAQFYLLHKPKSAFADKLKAGAMTNYLPEKFSEYEIHYEEVKGMNGARDFLRHYPVGSEGVKLPALVFSTNVICGVDKIESEASKQIAAHITELKKGADTRTKFVIILLAAAAVGLSGYILMLRRRA